LDTLSFSLDVQQGRYADNLIREPGAVGYRPFQNWVKRLGQQQQPPHGQSHMGKPPLIDGYRYVPYPLSSMNVNGYARSMKALPMAETRTKGCCQDLPDPIRGSEAQEFAELAKALADPTRVQMVHMLRSAENPVCVCDFTAAFDLRQPTVSHHVAKLKSAGLIDSEKIGIWTFYRMRPNLSRSAQLLLNAIP
jgi:ArsR family transcriptional regulator